MMKKFLILLCTVFMVGLSACSGLSANQETKQTDKEEQEMKNDENGQNDKTDVVTEGKKDKQDQAEQQSAQNHVEAVIYYLDDSGEVVSKKVEVSELNERTVWEELKKAGSVPEASEVLSLVTDEKKQMELDVDHAFGEALRSQGTAGEKELIQCVVNSYLDSYGFEKIRIVEEGDVLVSSHREYADFIEKITD